MRVWKYHQTPNGVVGCPYLDGQKGRGGFLGDHFECYGQAISAGEYVFVSRLGSATRQDKTEEIAGKYVRGVLVALDRQHDFHALLLLCVISHVILTISHRHKSPDSKEGLEKT